MSTRRSRLPGVLAAAALALPLGGCAGTAADASGGPSAASSRSAAVPSAEGQRIEVEVAGGEVTGGTGRVPVRLGERVTLVITSDVPDEAHVHGYDLTVELTAGTPAEITFTASVPGVFEVELHDSGAALLALQVS